MRALLVSADEGVRASMALILRSVQRAVRQPLDVLEASDGREGLKLAWRHRPDVVVTDEVVSGAGAFAIARDLKGAIPSFEGRIVILLDRPQDGWLAAWSGADAWFVKPVNPFEVADTITALAAAERKEAG